MFENYADLGVAHVGEYLGAWCIVPSVFTRAVDRLTGLDLRSHVDRQRELMARGDGLSPASYGYSRTSAGTAVIDLRGPLMKRPSSLSGGSSTVLVRRQLRHAAGDESVKSILLRIDSPGGTTSGTADLADDVAETAAVKPTWAYIEDMGASAAYWAASQASKIFAGRTAIVGSIGTYAVLEDSSEQAERLGVKVHVLKAGAYKGVGVEGSPITDEQLGEWQSLVDELNTHFIRAVACGRQTSFEAVEKLADGRVHVGKWAQRAGLVDGVQSLDDTLRMLAGEHAPERSPARSSRSAGGNPVRAATFAELNAALPDADAAFLQSQLQAGASIRRARRDWERERARRFEEQRKAQADRRRATELARADHERAKNDKEFQAELDRDRFGSQRPDAFGGRFGPN